MCFTGRGRSWLTRRYMSVCMYVRIRVISISDNSWNKNEQDRLKKSKYTSQIIAQWLHCNSRTFLSFPTTLTISHLYFSPFTPLKFHTATCASSLVWPHNKREVDAGYGTNLCMFFIYLFIFFQERMQERLALLESVFPAARNVW